MRMVVEYHTCVLMKQASTKSLESVTGTTMLTVLHLLIGEFLNLIFKQTLFNIFRYYLNDLTYREDPPKSSTESYNVRRKKSKWSIKEPQKTEKVTKTDTTEQVAALPKIDSDDIAFVSEFENTKVETDAIYEDQVLP